MSVIRSFANACEVRPTLLGLLVALVATITAGCLRTTAFQCETNSECGAGGTCEPVGYCSVIDPACASGSRFSDTAGSRANQCVEGSSLVDGATDSPVGGDAPSDAPNVGCPGTYATISGGQAGRVYRLVTSSNWDTHRAFCAATSASAYLAIPDDLGELQAIATLAATPRFWIGISDLATENTWLTTKGAAAVFLPWETNAPDNGPPPENCVEMVSATSQINDERCNTQMPAVCECEP
ncbi:MAG: C-type lectin domain-containing protein [Kofleriaceae bacterium]